ncbi:alpha/beta fold hydrolase [Streptomyces mirabilis]|uniref:alpha/beta fold hydrolase n=1 Tax=Streptomyces mirabilis TaxID=68239 RepID=UPI003673CDBD
MTTNRPEGVTEELIPTSLGLINLKDCSDALVEILDALDIDKCVLVDNSRGGMLAGSSRNTRSGPRRRSASTAPPP